MVWIRNSAAACSIILESSGQLSFLCLKEPLYNVGMTVTINQDGQHQERFYQFWEKLFDEMSDEVLESTIYMIKEYNELNTLAKQEQGYRNSTEIFIQ